MRTMGGNVATDRGHTRAKLSALQEQSVQPTVISPHVKSAGSAWKPENLYISRFHTHPEYPQILPMANPSHDPHVRLTELGLTLPPPPKPVAAYIPTRLIGNLLFVSGQIPLKDGALMATGIVPRDVPIETAQECARQCVLNGLAAASAALGSLSRIASVVRVGCFVACDDSFTDHPKVANGASELLVEIFGERGRHARAAVGAPSLPLGTPVEVEFLFEVTP